MSTTSIFFSMVLVKWKLASSLANQSSWLPIHAWVGQLWTCCPAVWLIWCAVVPYSHPRNGRKHKVINVDICVFNVMEAIFHGFLSKIRGAFKTHRSLNLPKGTTIVHESFDWSSSSKVLYCIDMSNVVRNSYPLCHCKICHMIGSGYCFLLTTLFYSQKSVTQWTLPSFFWGGGW